MYITPRQRKKNITTTIILAIAIPFTVLAAYLVTQLIIGAAGETDPKNVVVSNVTSNSITLSWSTDADSTGSVTVKKGGADSKPYLETRGNDRRKTHYVEVTDLEPNVEYAFTIISNTTKYTDEKGSAFKFKTTPITGDTPVPQPVFGGITGSNSNDNVAYVMIDGNSNVYPASGVVNSSGNWIIDLSGLRDGTNSLVKVEKDTKLLVVIRGKDNTGAKVSGSYNDIFDADGKLKDSSKLAMGTLSNVSSLFPDKSVITRVVVYTPPAPAPTPTPSPTPTPTPTPDPEPEIDARQFRIVQDVKWVMISGTNVNGEVTEEPTVVTGKESIQVTNLTDTGFTVIWLTSEKQVGSIVYGTTTDSQITTANDERDGLLEKKTYYAHSVKVTKLQPEKKYYFKVKAGDQTWDNAGQAFEVTTHKTLSSPPEFKTISGKINNLVGDAVIFARILNKDTSGSVGNSSVSSAIVDENGNWIATYGDMRNESGAEYFNPSDADVMEVKLMAYQNSSAISESMKNIDSKTIAIDLSTSSSVREIVKVTRLANYGVK